MKKERIIRFIATLSLGVICLSNSVFAETIILKSGDKIEANIIGKTDRYIEIDFYGVSIPYYFEDIESIDGKTPLAFSTKEETPSKDSVIPDSKQRKYNLRSVDTEVIFDKTYLQKDGLFKIDAPKGWRWVEKPGDIKITNPQGTNFVSIIFRSLPADSIEQEKSVTNLSNQMMTKLVVNSHKGEIIRGSEKWIDGVYAHHFEYLLPRKRGNRHFHYITFFNKGYLFNIGFGSQLEEERSEMEKIVETLKF